MFRAASTCGWEKILKKEKYEKDKILHSFYSLVDFPSVDLLVASFMFSLSSLVMSQNIDRVFSINLKYQKILKRRIHCWFLLVVVVFHLVTGISEHLQQLVHVTSYGQQGRVHISFSTCLRICNVRSYRWGFGGLYLYQEKHKKRIVTCRFISFSWTSSNPFSTSAMMLELPPSLAYMARIVC